MTINNLTNRLSADTNLVGQPLITNIFLVHHFAQIQLRLLKIFFILHFLLGFSPPPHGRSAKPQQNMLGLLQAN